MVYAIELDHTQALELAVIAAGGEMQPGELVAKYNDWLLSEPVAVDIETAQLMAALGVGP